MIIFYKAKYTSSILWPSNLTHRYLSKRLKTHIRTKTYIKLGYLHSGSGFLQRQDPTLRGLPSQNNHIPNIHILVPMHQELAVYE